MVLEKKSEKNNLSNNIQKYINIIQKSKDIPKEFELQCIKKAKKDKKYKQILFEAHLKMVIGIARKYSVHNETFEDLIQEGIKGLEHALTLFNSKANVRFNTYARYWVRAYILKYFSNNVRGFKIPSDIAIKLHRINTTIEKLSKKLLRNPTNEEISDELNYDKDYVGFLRKYLFPHLALDSTILDNNGQAFCTIGDSLVDDYRDNARESLIRNDNILQIKKAIQTLSKKERFVIENRYGLNGEDELILEEVGKKIGLTAERVRQIQQSAEIKLKKIMNQ